MQLSTNLLTTGSTKHFYRLNILCLSNSIFRFQNGCNEVVIEPRGVQFWSEMMLVISNQVL